MARNIDHWNRKIIVHIICSRKRFTTSQQAKVAKVAKVAKWSERSATNIRKIIRLYSSTRSGPIPAGWSSNITPVMLDALCDQLAEKPGLYVEEMANFLWFSALPSSSSTKRALAQVGWTKKKPDRKQKNRTLNCEMSTSIHYPTFVGIIRFSVMNPDIR